MDRSNFHPIEENQLLFQLEEEILFQPLPENAGFSWSQCNLSLNEENCGEDRQRMINHSKFCAACVVCDGIYHLVGTPCGEGLTMIQRLKIENPGLSKSQRKNRKKRDAAKVTNPFKTKF